MQNVPSSVIELSKILPKFPNGRINYKNSPEAAVVTVFVEFEGKILLLKRSNKVGTYRGMWNTVAGYLDELKPVENKARKEVEEELGIKTSEIKTIKIGKNYEFTDENIHKTWIVYPVLVTLSTKPNIKIDWEHTEFTWIDPKDIGKFEIVPKLEESLKRAM